MAGLAGLNPDFEQKLVTFLDSLPSNVRNRISLNSGYRDEATQARLFQNAVAKYGSVAEARKWVAPPGNSQHNLGKAMDLGIPNDLMAMIHAEAPKYGLTFPLSNENWHIEAIGGRGGGSSTGITNEQAALPIQESVSDTQIPTGVLDSGNPANDAYDRMRSHALTNRASSSIGVEANAPQGVKLPTINAPAQYQSIISDAAQANNVDPQILTNLLHTESGFNPTITSPAGARGIAQFMPATAASMGIDPLNPQQSIAGAAKYLKDLSARYGGNIKLGLAAYNWGMGNVDKIGGDLSKAPASVQAYVNSIAGGVTGAGDTQNSLTSLAKQAVTSAADIPAMAIDSALPIVANAEKGVHALLDSAGPKAFDLPGMAVDQSPGMSGMAGASPITSAIGGANAPPIFAKVPGAPEGTKLLPPVATSGLLPWRTPDRGIDVTGALEKVAQGIPQVASEITNTRDPQTYLERVARDVAPAVATGAGIGSIVPGVGTLAGVGAGLAGDLALNALAPTNAPKAYDIPGMAVDQSPGMSGMIKPNPITGSIGAGDPTTPPPDMTVSGLHTPLPQADIFNLKNDSAALPAIQLAAQTIPPAIMASVMALPNFTKELGNLTAAFLKSPVVAQNAYDKYGIGGLLLAAGTMGFAFAPTGVKMITDMRPVRVHDLDLSQVPGKLNKATGVIEPTQSILRPIDPIASIAVDYTKGIINPLRRYMDKVGLNTDFLHHLEMGWQHSAAFMANMNSFFQNGEMNTLMGRIKVANDGTIAIVGKANQLDPDVGKYLDLLRMKDDFLVGQKNVIGNKTRNDVITEITNMETAKPQLKQVADIMRANRSAWGQFLVDTGHISQADLTKMLWTRPNSIDPEHISTPSMRRNITQPTSSQMSSIDEHVLAMMDGSRNAFKNWVNNNTITGALRSGLRLFTEVPAAKASEWKDKTTIVRTNVNGEAKYYATNPTWAVIMEHGPDKLNPYLIGGLKRWQEMIGTGVGNPGYGVTAQQRGIGQAHVTWRGWGSQPVGIIRTKLAVPQMLIPQIAQTAARNVEASLLTDKSLWWLPDQHRQALAMRLHDFVENSSKYILETHGGVSQGSSVSDIAKMNYREKNRIGMAMPSFFRGLWHGYQDLLYATHGSPNTAFAMRELGVRLKRGEPLDQAATEAAYAGANVTGNPRMTGASSMSGISLPGRPVRTDNSLALLSKDGQAGRIERGITEAVRTASNLGRGAIPWYNVQVQSMRNVWEAYVRNPVGFTTSLYSHVIMPAIGAYLWNSALGPEYVQHMMEGRSPQASLTQLPIGIPGRDPYDGQRWALPQELSIFSRGAQIILDHALRGGQVNSTQDDMMAILSQYVRGAIIPSPPGVQVLSTPIGNLASDAANSMFGSFFPSNNPNATAKDQVMTEPGDISPTASGIISSLIGPLGSAFISAYQAAHDDPGGYLDKTVSALSEGAREAAKTIPGARMLLNIPSMPVQRTQLNLQLASKENYMRFLSNYWAQKGKYFWAGKEPMINTGKRIDPSDPTSEYDAYTNIGKGGKTSMPYTFPSMPPNNPDWWKLAARIQQNFMTDNGYKLSITRDAYDFANWHRKRDALDSVIRDMRGKPNYGNLASWEQTIKENPYFAYVVKDMGPLNRNSPDIVYRYAVTEKAKLDRQMLQAVLAAEQSMSKDVGHPVKLENISPWIKGALP